MQIDPRALTERVLGMGERWADEDAAASALEEVKKSVLAEAVAKVVDESLAAGGKPVSMVQAEARALKSDGYKEHLAKMVEARRIANRARVAYDMGKVELELIRSQMATMRAEISMGR